MNKNLKGKIKLFREIIMGRLGLQNDFVGYESLIRYIDKNKIYELEGDFLEIGAFMGGGSKKLAKYANKYGKTLFVIDLFDPDFDPTPNERGERMNWIYKKILGKKNLRAVFDANTKDEKNIVVLSGNSKNVQLPRETKLCFSFIDGNHNPEYVKNDFYLAWNKTVSGGIVAFHDYGGDLPQTSKAIKNMIEQNQKNVAGTEMLVKKCIIFIKKKAGWNKRMDWKQKLMYNQ